MQRLVLGFTASAVLCIISSGHASAGLIAVAPGYSVSTFVTGFSDDGFGQGPFGIGFTSSGTVMVADRFGVVRTFNDVDGQTLSNALTTNSYTVATLGLANAAGKMYLADQGSGSILQLNNDGSLNHTVVTGLSAPTGLAAAPNGNLYVSNRGNGTIEVINPIAQTATPFEGTGSNVNYDGLQVSADGKTLYVATDTNHVVGFDTTSGLQVFDSGLVALASGRVDGMALGTGTIAGNVFVNTNGGQVIEINIGSLAETLIASGGTRGDFVGVDPNGTLLLTQSTEIDRLTAPAGGGFGGAPEPATLTLAALGIGGLAVCRAYRRRQQAATR